MTESIYNLSISGFYSYIFMLYTAVVIAESIRNFAVHICKILLIIFIKKKLLHSHEM